MIQDLNSITGNYYFAVTCNNACMVHELVHALDVTCKSNCSVSKKSPAMSSALQLTFGVFVLVCASEAVSSLPADCSVVGWSVPKPPDGPKLLQVQAIIRSACMGTMHE